MVERYSNDLTAAGTTVFTQTVTGLSEGTYNVVVYATANNARNESGIKSDAQDIAYVYAGSDKSHKAYVLSHYQDAVVMPHIYALNNVTVEADGNLEIGMYAEKTGTQWQTFQIKSLTKVDIADQPNVTKKVTVGGTAISNTDAFTSIAETSTLEVEATEYIPVYFTNATEAFTYTPETTCTVRFVRTGGSIYVYEGTTYKGTVSTFTPTLFTTFAADYRPTDNNQLLQNPDFETVGTTIATDKYKFGTPWTTNVTEGELGIRVGVKNDKKVVVWRGTKNSNYFGQSLTTLKPNTKYQVMLEQVDAGNANATFYMGIGSTEGTHGLCETNVKLGTNQNGVKTASFTTPASIEEGTTYYFTFQNTVSYNSASSGSDPVTQIDWISLEEPYSWALTGVSSASYLDGTAYIPYTLADIRSEFSTVYASIATTLENDDYANITGTERTNLETAKNTTYNGYTSENIVDYETAISEINGLIANFTAAKTNYDELVAEIAKSNALGLAAAAWGATSESTAATALAKTHDLKEAEYRYVTNTYQYGVELGTWTTTGPTGSLSEQHYKGSGNSYLEQSSAAWGQSAWTIKYDQDLTLPAGDYVFKVAGRQADNDGVTLSLTVKNGETVLGTVSDFPRGDTGLGINTSGATDFTTGEDHEYVNNGAGRGWEWRYVKFTLATDATVNVAVDAVATTSHMWVSFCDATVQTNNKANVSLIAYNIALGSAQTTIANTDYANVTGSEKTALQNAISADGTLDKTDNDAIVAATTALDNARVAFTDAKSAYDGFVAAKAVNYENNLPYASSAKFAAIATAQSAADATSADDATAKTNAILSAYRKYVESNAMAEGITGAETITINEPRFAGLTSDDIDATNWKIGTAWTITGQNNGSISFNTTNSLTDGDGNTDYQYVRIQKTDNNGGIKQTVNLAPGKYLMTVATRCQSGQGAKFEAFAGGVWVDAPQNNNVGGVYGNGWDDTSVEFYVTETSDVEFGVSSNWGKNIWWTATRFRLVKLPTPEVTISQDATTAPEPAGYANVTLTRTLKGGQWNGFSVPFGFTVAGSALDGASVKEFDSVDENTITMKDATEIVAGEPYLVKPASADIVNPTFSGVSVTNPEEAVKGTGDYKFAAHLYNTSLATDGSVAYVSTTDSSIKKLTSGSIKGMRSYFQVPTTSTARALVLKLDGETTAIMDVKGDIVEGNIYNVAGQRVKNAGKGLYIVNGKKVVIK